MQADKLRELRELLAKAAPGPWSLSGIGRLLSSDRYCIGDGVYGPDADFILAMYQALPDLLAIAEGAEADRADAAIGRIVWKFIDRMNDVCEQDPADRIVAQFVAAVEPLMLAKIDALAGAVTQGEDHG